MEIVELAPLPPTQMLEAYVMRFKTTKPLTEEALLALGRMSRGIFRRYLRYITLTLDLWESQPSPRKEIDPQIVKEAITIERISADMALELSEVFPKHSELQEHAARLLMGLEESGPRKQSQLAQELKLEPYVLSRLLRKMELHRYVNRKRAGTDKIVTLVTESVLQPPRSQVKSRRATASK